jgi:hypothetical protein
LGVLIYFMLFEDYPFKGNYVFMKVWTWNTKSNPSATKDSHSLTQK